ncbi:hypothetical protein CHC07_03279 [Variovorax sp. B4]|nr:hypothetical protein CHC06_04232 [Variovorax sp. B2]PNG53464.1 hypothetical protein CHC07_03279 [Variovorax sp. B4]
MVTAPSPWMTPPNVPLGFDSVSVRAPRSTVPVPIKLVTVAPLVVPVMSKAPWFTRALELAMLPAPPSASVVSTSTVVAPV